MINNRQHLLTILLMSTDRDMKIFSEVILILKRASFFLLIHENDARPYPNSMEHDLNQ